MKFYDKLIENKKIIQNLFNEDFILLGFFLFVLNMFLYKNFICLKCVVGYFLMPFFNVAYY